MVSADVFYGEKRYLQASVNCLGVDFGFTLLGSYPGPATCKAHTMCLQQSLPYGSLMHANYCMMTPLGERRKMFLYSMICKLNEASKLCCCVLYLKRQQGRRVHVFQSSHLRHFLLKPQTFSPTNSPFSILSRHFSVVLISKVDSGGPESIRSFMALVVGLDIRKRNAKCLARAKFFRFFQDVFCCCGRYGMRM